MKSPPKVLSSDEPLEGADRSFKLSAGPGAGKTHWLAGHVKAVLAKGERLHGRARIACITYTQIGSETLAKRLVGYEDRLWISTIHSFLYHQVVRPYAHLLGKSSLMTSKLDGHDLRRPSANQGKAWLKALGKKELMWYAMPQLSSLLEKDVRWTRQADGSWKLGFRKGVRLAVRGGAKAFEVHAALLAHKHSLWERGRIDHDDVIHLAHRVLLENDPVMRAILARFPYLLLDEFQDTGRLQCEIVEAFAGAGATVGVIGDRNQAIFEFSDAEPELFDHFEPNGCLRCEIEGNRRSTQQIVDVLNKLRQDGLQQISIAEVKDGPRPMVVVGELREAVTFAKDQCGPEGLDMVARGHAGVARLLLLDDTPSTSEIWKDCGDEDREFFLTGFCRAIRHFEVGEGRQALAQLPGLFRGRSLRAPLKGGSIEGDKQRRAFKVDTLAWVVSFRKQKPDANVLEFYEALAEHLEQSSWDVGLKGLRKETRGKPAKFYMWAKNTRFGSLVAAVGLETTRAKARTIHGFKGDETRSLLLLLDDKRLRNKLTNPGDSEDDRLIYVALSRAKEQLFVAVPDLQKSEEASLRDMGFDVKRI